MYRRRGASTAPALPHNPLQGYEYFGFNRVDGGIVYREWAPAAAGASLIGDFNSWNSESHKMVRGRLGASPFTSDRRPLDAPAPLTFTSPPGPFLPPDAPFLPPDAPALPAPPPCRLKSRDKFGVWSITLPDVDGKPAIPHRSRVKVQFTKGFSGERVDRVPAYIKWAKAEEGKMGAHYDGYYWEPPESEKARSPERPGLWRAAASPRARGDARW